MQISPLERSFEVVSERYKQKKLKFLKFFNVALKVAIFILAKKSEKNAKNLPDVKNKKKY